ncbi:MAG: hypothetical protein U7126_15275 [Microcoleus sp.]
MAFNPSFLPALPTTSLPEEPQIQVLPPAARKRENGKKQTANHQTPRQIATELIEEEECRSSLSQVSGGAHGHRA